MAREADRGKGCVVAVKAQSTRIQKGNGDVPPFSQIEESMFVSFCTNAACLNDVHVWIGLRSASHVNNCLASIERLRIRILRALFTRLC